MRRVAWYSGCMLIEGLGEVRAQRPERFPLRMRGTTNTVSGWRIAVEAPRGPGTIVVADRGAEIFYRGDGVFLGWPQEKLEAAYRSLLPAPEAPELDFPQLG